MSPSRGLAKLVSDQRDALAAECERRIRPLALSNPAVHTWVREILGQLPAVLAGGAFTELPEPQLGLSERIHACAVLRETVLRLAASRPQGEIALSEVVELDRALDKLLEAAAARGSGHAQSSVDAQARLSEAFKSALDAIVTIDEDSRVLAWNPAAEDIFGIRRDEALGKCLPDLIMPPEQREAHLHGVQRFLSTGEPRIIGRRVEMEAQRVDGSRIPVELAITATEVGGKKAFVGFIRDISVRKAAEREREQMVGVLSHDLRTPLTAVAVSAGTLMRDATLTDAQKRAVNRIVGSAERMRRMINDLLDVAQSRLGGGLPITRASTDLAQLARAVLEEIRLIHPTRDVHLEVSGDCRAEVDGDRIAQALNNLVQNALTHGSADTPVEVSVRCGHQEAILAVANQGPAIPESVMAVIWEPFRRGQGAEGMKRSGGLGLGLYIVREIVRAHGGTASASSNAARTVFSMAIPMRLVAPDELSGAKS